MPHLTGLATVALSFNSFAYLFFTGDEKITIIVDKNKQVNIKKYILVLTHIGHIL